jgi:O-antigen/teichoic acid export membrane protein
MMHRQWSSIQQRLSLALPAGSLRARLAGGAFWSLVGAVATQGSSTLSAIITARFLGDHGFGELGMVRNTLTMFAAFAGLGMGLTANKYLAETRTADPDRAGRILGLSYGMACGSGLLMMVLAFTFAEPLASRTMANEGLARYLRLSAPILLTGTLNGVQTASLAGLEAFRRSSLWTTVVAVTGSVLTVIGVATAGISGALWAGLISGVLGFVVLQRVLAAETRRARIRVTFRGIRQELPLLWSFALPSVLSGLMVSPVAWAAAAMLVNRPGGYGEMGVFNAANQWRNLVLFVPGAVGQVVLPMLSNLQATGERDRYVRALKLNGVLSLLVCLCAALPVIAGSEWIMRTYGPDFRGRWAVLVLLVLSGVLQAGTSVVGQALASLGRMWWGLILNGAWAVGLLVATWVCLPLGATGLALAYLVSYLLHMVQVGCYTVWVLRHELAPSDGLGMDIGGTGGASMPAPASEAEGAVEAVVASAALSGSVANLVNSVGRGRDTVIGSSDGGKAGEG